MNVVGKVRSLISQGVYSVATPFHPFGGAVDIVIVEQPDGTYRSTPWYVRFGKFQGVLRGSETVVRIAVNDVEAGFHMYLDNSGEAYFLREVMSGKENEDDQDLDNIGILEASQDGKDSSDINCQTENELSIADDIEISNVCDENVKINSEHGVFEFHDERISHASPIGSPGYGSYHCGSFKDVGELAESQGGSDSEVVLVSVDGHVLTAPFSSSEKNNDNVQLSMPQFHLGPAEVADVAIEQLQDSAESSGNNGDLRTSKDAWTTGLFGDTDALTPSSVSEGIFPICGDDNTPSYPSDGCRDVRKFTYQAQEALNMKNVRDNLGMNSDTGIGEKEIFTSCLELSELISGSEGDNSRGIDSPSMGLAATGGTCDPQEETETGDEHKLENGAGLTLPNSESLCSNESPTVITQIESPENSALITEKTDSVISEGVTIPPSTNGSERKSEQLGVPSEMQRLASGQELPAFEDCNKPGIWDSHSGESSDKRSNVGMGIEISLCHNLLRAGMGLDSAKEAFNSQQITEEEFKVSGVSIVKNENLIVRFKEKYFTWDKAAPIILGIAAFGLDFPVELKDDIPVEKETPKLIVDSSQLSSSAGSSWRLWPIPFRRIKTLQHSNSNSSSEEVFVDSEPYVSPRTGLMQDCNGDIQPPQKQFVRTNIPTSEQIASLNLKDGQNMVAFSCYTRVLGKQKVDAHIYLWKWNARIVISDVDGTITRSDVLGQFMPLVGRDWTQSGVAQLFSAIKENGYQLLFLSARAIVQAYLTRSFLFNLKQDGKALPSGPVVISPDGLLPSLYREVIRRAPHEFKIACLQDIRALFPSDYNPFYAGFGNRDTDELSYRKIGIPKGKIFIINPKGEVAVNHSIDVKSYTSLHTLVHDMFPPTSLAEQEDFNSWNYWKMPLPDIDC